MKSWHDKYNVDNGAIPNSCTGWFSTLKALKDHCVRHPLDPWHDLFMNFLEFRETSDSGNEDDNDNKNKQEEEEGDTWPRTWVCSQRGKHEPQI